jgi:hypothetical protein
MAFYTLSSWQMYSVRFARILRSWPSEQNRIVWKGKFAGKEKICIWKKKSAGG